ncbi:hypothetical protein DLY41_26155 [Escherichia coli]|nr:hypothetical protein [Escherichia coli]
MASVVMENNAVIVAGPSWKMKYRGSVDAQKRAVYEIFRKGGCCLIVCYIHLITKRKLKAIQQPDDVFLMLWFPKCQLNQMVSQKYAVVVLHTY